LLAITAPFMPFFGRYLTGPAGAVLVVAAVDALLSFSLYRLRLAGWWIAICALALRMISAILAFRRADLLHAYSKMGWSDTQVQQMSANPAFRRGAMMLWWSVAFLVLFIGYMLWIKRYFRRAAAPTAAEPEMPCLPSSGGTSL
jgi:hypothetical protein